MAVSGAEESGLVSKAVSGDRTALEDLLILHGTRLSRHVAALVLPEMQSAMAVDDVLQQAYVKAFRGIGRLRENSQRTFYAWLKVIAENELQDAVRGMRRRKRGGDRVRAAGPDGTAASAAELLDLLPSSGETPSRGAARREAVRALQVAVAGLSHEQAEAVRLHLLGGKSLEESAATLGRSPGAVRALIHRAKQRLREAMRRSSLWFGKR